jgi:hypothetical protein
MSQVPTATRTNTTRPEVKSLWTFYDTFWIMSIKQASQLYAGSTKSVAPARRMSFIATYVETPRVHQTLAQSTHLAKRVRSFESHFVDPYLAMALRNMTSLRILKLSKFYVKLLDG